MISAFQSLTQAMKRFETDFARKASDRIISYRCTFFYNIVLLSHFFTANSEIIIFVAIDLIYFILQKN